MLAGAIKQLIENTRYKVRQITTPTELDSTLEPPFIIRFNIIQPKRDSLLHHIRVDTPTIIRTFYDHHEIELLSMLKYVQTLALVNAYHALDIDLRAEAAVKHYLWKIEHNFKGQELDPSYTLSKELKGPFVKRQKEPLWIARE